MNRLLARIPYKKEKEKEKEKKRRYYRDDA
jgi:hypothetical protein